MVLSLTYKCNGINHVNLLFYFILGAAVNHFREQLMTVCQQFSNVCRDRETDLQSAGLPVRSPNLSVPDDDDLCIINYFS